MIFAVSALLGLPVLQQFLGYEPVKYKMVLVMFVGIIMCFPSFRSSYPSRSESVFGCL